METIVSWVTGFLVGVCVAAVAAIGFVVWRWEPIHPHGPLMGGPAKDTAHPDSKFELVRSALNGYQTPASNKDLAKGVRPKR